MNRLPTFSVGPQKQPHRMATYDHAETPIRFSPMGFMAGVVAGILFNLIVRAFA